MADKTLIYSLQFRGLEESTTQIGRLDSELTELKRNIKGQREGLAELASFNQQNTKAYKDLSKELGQNIAKASDLSKQKSDLVRVTKNEVKANKEEVGSINSLRARLSVLTAEYNKLSKAERDNTSIGKQRRIEIRRTSDELKRLESQIGDNTRNVGNYSTALRGFSTQLLGSFGIIVGIQGFARALKSAANTSIEYRAALDKLSAISKSTASDLKALEEQSLQLGASTKFTATEVVLLQTELAKLGFTTQEILNTSEAVLLLSTITGDSLAENAALAGSTIRIFNLDASESARVVDVLAKSFTSSALDFEKFKNAITQAGPVARTFGFTLEETTALLAKLSDAGFEGSKSGTALRNILLNLADANGKLAKGLGGNVTSFDELIPALIELRESGVNLNETLELTDKRSVAAFNQFLQTAEGANVLKESLDEATGSAKEASDIIQDNLLGDLDKLKAAWESAVLSNDAGLNRLLRGLTDIGIGLGNYVAGTAFLSDEPSFFDQLNSELSQYRERLGDFKTEQEFKDEITQVAKTLELFRAANASSEEVTRLLNKLNEANRSFSEYNKSIQRAIVATKDIDSAIDGLTDEELTTLLADLENLLENDIKKFGEFSDDANDTRLAIDKLKGALVDLITTGGNTGTTLESLGEDLKKIKEDLQKTEVGTREFLRLQRESELLETRIRSLVNLTKNLREEFVDLSDAEIVKGLEGLIPPVDEIRSAFEEVNQLLSVDPFNPDPENLASGSDIKTGEQVRNERIQKTDAGIEAARIANDAIINIVSNRIDNQIREIERLRDAEIEATEASTLSQVEKDRKIEAIQKNAASRTLGLQKKQFEAQKRADIAASIVNAASAILRTIAVFGAPIPPNFPAIAGVASAAAIGATEIGVIASRKFAKGGELPAKEGGYIKGNSHANGGVPFAVGGKVMEAEGGELIVNKNIQSRPDFVEAISTMNYLTGGKKFAVGGEVPRFTASGRNLAPEPNNSQLIEGIQLAMSNITVQNVVTDTVSRNAEIISIQNTATFGG